MSFPAYASYKATPFDGLPRIPAHWTPIRLRRVVQLNPSKGEVANRAADTAVSFVPMESVGEDGSLRLLQERRLSDVTSGYTYFRDGDVVVAKITPCFENGKGALVHGLTNGIGFGTTELIVARPNEHFLLGSYLHLIFTSAEFRLVAEAHMYGAGGQKRVPDDFVQQFVVALPSVSEQGHIVRFLEREMAKIDALVAEQERLIELLHEKRQAVIAHAVTAGLNPEASMKSSGIEWLGDLPAHWTFGCLTRIADRVIVGIAEAATHAYSDEGTSILRSTNIRAGAIIGEILRVNTSFADERASKRLEVGDLVTVRTGNAGVTAVVPKELDGCQCFTMLVTSLSDGFVPEYYCYWLNSLPAQRYFALEGWGTAQVNISVPILKALPAPFPPITEQRAIVEYLDQHLRRIDSLVKESELAARLLRERRGALISAAVTGTIDVRCIEGEADAA